MQAILQDFLEHNPRLAVITGAGLSAGSGIPCYRNERGDWLRSTPVQHQDFLRSGSTRQLYWARSYAGWPKIEAAAPGRGHRALQQLEQRGYLSTLISQNVDRLHHLAGHQRVVDLHGRLDRVYCLECDASYTRGQVQSDLQTLNPSIDPNQGVLQADGDTDIPPAIVASFKVPACASCGGILKPDVVFFGDTVARDKVDAIIAVIESCDALMVVGSSLMVFSGFRFARLAHQLGKPMAILNRGVTRADPLAALKIESDCNGVLESLLNLPTRNALADPLAM